MSTILSHTTRAPGTILTAAIYNQDHLVHITNALALNTDKLEAGATQSPLSIFDNSAGENVDGALIQLEQQGAGDATIQILNPNRSWYLGIDQSDSDRLKLATTSGTPNFATDTVLTVDPADGSITLIGGLTLASNININPGSDIDADLIIVGVTGTPTLSWVEASDAFLSNKPWIISSDGNGDITHTIAGAPVVSNLEVHSEGSTDLGGIAIHRHTDVNNFGGHLLFMRSDGTHASAGAVDDNDVLGRIIGLGYDGTDYETAAEIQFLVNGISANNDMPGEIAFFTNAGSQTLTRRMSIFADGSVDIVSGPLTVNSNAVWDAGDFDIADYYTSAQTDSAISTYAQPLDSDLTSWAGVTRVAGFDTFAATPSSANLAAIITDETGSGLLVFGTAPVLTGATLAGTLACADNTVGRAALLDYGITVNPLGDLGGGTDDIDLTAGNVVSATVSTATQTFTFSNPPTSGVEGKFTLYLTNGGSQTVNWPASVDWAGGSPPTLTAAGLDVLVFTTIDGGTTWYGFVAGLDMG